jgi:hypothetical protein
MEMAMTRGEGSIEVVDEQTMLAVARGREDELRLRFVRARSPEGKDLAWHDLRLWSNDRPTPKGITIRASEIGQLVEALARPTSDLPASATQPPAADADASTGPRAGFGRSKGKLLADLADDDLKWLAAALEQSIINPAKANFRAKNDRDLADVRAEMKGRFLE